MDSKDEPMGVLQAFPFFDRYPSLVQNAGEQRHTDIALMWVGKRQLKVPALHELVIAASVRP